MGKEPDTNTKNSLQNFIFCHEIREKISKKNIYIPDTYLSELEMTWYITAEKNSCVRLDEI